MGCGCLLAFSGIDSVRYVDCSNGLGRRMNTLVFHVGDVELVRNSLDAGNRRFVLAACDWTFSFARSGFDIAIAYLEALAMLEALQPFCSQDGWKRFENELCDSHDIVGLFEVVEADGFLGAVEQLSDAFHPDADGVWRAELGAEQQERIHRGEEIAWTEVGDAYLMNMLAGLSSLEEVEQDWFRSKYPEWDRFGVVVSSATPLHGETVLASSFGLAVVGNNRIGMLGIYIRYGDERLRSGAAYLIRAPDGVQFLLSDHGAYEAPIESLGRFQAALLGLGIKLSGEAQWWVNNEGAFVEARFPEASVFLVRCVLHRPSERSLPALTTAIATGNRHLEALAKVELSWSAIDFAVFEVLCYDIARECGDYIPSTVRIRGNACGSDRGRDLSMVSYSGSGRGIGQCKFTQQSRNVGRAALSGIAETLLEHGAAELCLFTNGQFSSPALDTLEAMCKRTGVKLSLWDGVRLSRFISQRPHLRYRYFSSR